RRFCSFSLLKIGLSALFACSTSWLSVVISCTCFALSRSSRLHLTSHWLEAAGFGTDTSVVITVEHGQLLIRIVTE
ncbi:type I addiction module toxin, SymE family, partial [Pectobacterium versatile]|nr:type I addiction module toxin, SymE family [Pectobacterium versatile]